MALPSLLILPATENGEALFAKPSGESYVVRRVATTMIGTLESSDLHIILPGQTARIFETELPKSGRAQQLKMARFAREDDIASGADSLHFALSDDQPPRLAVIDQEVMGQLKASLVNLRPKAAYLDYDLLEGDQALLVIDRAVEPGLAALDLDWVEAELVQPTDTELATQFADGIAAGRGINLLQGDFRPRSSLDLPRPALIRFGALAACAALVAFIWSGVSDRAKIAQAQTLQAQTAEDYTAVTGQPAPTSPGRSAAKAAQAGPQSAVSFLDLSAVLFSGMAELDDIRVDQLRYSASDGSLAVRFVYPSFDAAARAEAAIATAGGRLQTGGVRERDGSFVGEATLSLDPAL